MKKMKKGKRGFRKFKLLISDNIEKRYLKIASELMKYDGQNIDQDIKPDGEICYITYDGNIIDVPCKSWLKNPIPLNFEDWIDQYHDDADNDFGTIDMQRCHQWSTELERMNHLPKQTFDEFWNEFLSSIIDKDGTTSINLLSEEKARLIWEAAEKNRGY